MTTDTKVIPTTQTDGVPITEEQGAKLKYLKTLCNIDLNDWLNPNDYPADRWEAWKVFCEKFLFYDMFTVGEYEYIYNLRSTVPHITVDPIYLLDPERYFLPERYNTADLQQLRWQIEQRLTLYDCFQGVMLVVGEPGAGKSCWAGVHTMHGREWNDLNIVTYKTKYPDAHGETRYIDDEDFVEQLSKVTELVERKGKLCLEWKTAKEDFMGLFNYAMIVVEEGHKVFSPENRTRLNRFWKEFLAEWRHYHCMIIIVTQYPQKIDKGEVWPLITHHVRTSLNLLQKGITDVEIRVRPTSQYKPLIPLNRDSFSNIWVHDAPIAMSSNVSAKYVKQIHEERKAKRETEENKGVEPLEKNL